MSSTGHRDENKVSHSHNHSDRRSAGTKSHPSSVLDTQKDVRKTIENDHPSMRSLQAHPSTARAEPSAARLERVGSWIEGFPMVFPASRMQSAPSQLQTPRLPEPPSEGSFARSRTRRGETAPPNEGAEHCNLLGFKVGGQDRRAFTRSEVLQAMNETGGIAVPTPSADACDLVSAYGEYIVPNPTTFEQNVASCHELLENAVGEYVSHPMGLASMLQSEPARDELDQTIGALSGAMVSLFPGHGHDPYAEESRDENVAYVWRDAKACLTTSEISKLHSNRHHDSARTKQSDEHNYHDVHDIGLLKFAGLLNHLSIVFTYGPWRGFDADHKRRRRYWYSEIGGIVYDHALTFLRQMNIREDDPIPFWRWNPVAGLVDVYYSTTPEGPYPHWILTMHVTYDKLRRDWAWHKHGTAPFRNQRDPIRKDVNKDANLEKVHKFINEDDHRKITWEGGSRSDHSFTTERLAMSTPPNLGKGLCGEAWAWLSRALHSRYNGGKASNHEAMLDGTLLRVNGQTEDTLRHKIRVLLTDATSNLGHSFLQHPGEVQLGDILKTAGHIEDLLKNEKKQWPMHSASELDLREIFMLFVEVLTNHFHKYKSDENGRKGYAADERAVRDHFSNGHRTHDQVCVLTTRRSTLYVPECKEVQTVIDYYCQTHDRPNAYTNVHVLRSVHVEGKLQSMLAHEHTSDIPTFGWLNLRGLIPSEEFYASVPKT